MHLTKSLEVMELRKLLKDVIYPPISFSTPFIKIAFGWPCGQQARPGFSAFLPTRCGPKTKFKPMSGGQK